MKEEKKFGNFSSKKIKHDRHDTESQVFRKEGNRRGWRNLQKWRQAKGCLIDIMKTHHYHSSKIYNIQVQRSNNHTNGSRGKQEKQCRDEMKIKDSEKKTIDETSRLLTLLCLVFLRVECPPPTAPPHPMCEAVVQTGTGKASIRSRKETTETI